MIFERVLIWQYNTYFSKQEQHKPGVDSKFPLDTKLFSPMCLSWNLSAGGNERGEGINKVRTGWRRERKLGRSV